MKGAKRMGAGGGREGSLKLAACEKAEIFRVREVGLS
jgi:hypothetical protein